MKTFLVVLCIIILIAQDNFSQSDYIIKNIDYSGKSEDLFGYAVSSDNEWVAVAAPFEDDDTLGHRKLTDMGAVYLYFYESGSWQFHKKIIQEVPTNGANYGISVSLSGDILVVGAESEKDLNRQPEQFQGGSVYIYEKNNGGENNWGLVKKIEYPGENISYVHKFGCSVSVDGDYLVVGAKFINVSNGQAFVFHRSEGGDNNWGLQQTIRASDYHTDDAYGTSVDISGDYVVIGSPGNKYDAGGSNQQNNAGAIYLYNRNQGGINSWGELKKIVSPARNNGKYFGNAVSLSEEDLLVGENSIAFTENLKEGSAYIFSKDSGGVDNWGIVTELKDISITDDFSYGYSVEISNDMALIGCVNETIVFQDDTISSAGKLYVYHKNTGGISNWGLSGNVSDSTLKEFDWFGNACSVSDSLIVVGAMNNDEDETNERTIVNAGSVYSFTFHYTDDTLTINNTEKKCAPDRNNSVFNGKAAIYNDIAVIGVPFDNLDSLDLNPIESSGAAYIFIYDSLAEDWDLLKKITAKERSTNANFGDAVDIFNHQVIIGAPSENEHGAVYIFDQNKGGENNWGEVKKIAPPDSVENNIFGTAVAISDNNVLITDPKLQKGRAYIYKSIQDPEMDWQLVNSFDCNPNTLLSTRFGYSVALNDQTGLVVSSFEKSPEDEDGGAVYMLQKISSGGDDENWIHSDKIYSGYIYPYDVSISGTDAMVFNSDVAYMYNIEDSALDLSYNVYNPPMGSNINSGAILGDNWIFGVPDYSNDTNEDIGMVQCYFKNHTNGLVSKELYPIDNNKRDRFGNDVDISEEFGVILSEFVGDVYFYYIDKNISLQVDNAFEPKANLKIYPNPASDYLTIQITDVIYGQDFQVGLYSIVGQRIYQKICYENNITLPVSDLDNGFYLIRVQTGNESHTSKVLIQ